MVLIFMYDPQFCLTLYKYYNIQSYDLFSPLPLYLVSATIFSIRTIYTLLDLTTRYLYLPTYIISALKFKD